MELLERYGPHIQNDLHAWAAEHTEQNPELFTLLPADPETYQHQKIMVHTVEGARGEEALEPELINSIARDVDSRYDDISKAIEANRESLELIGEILDSGQNVVLGTDHVELIDIALLLVKVKTALLQQGYEFDTGIIVSKMVAFLGVNYNGTVIPATDLLRLGVEETYLTIPSTTTSKIRMTAPRKVLAAYNDRMITHGIVKRLRESPKIGKAMLLGAALPGTVNKPIDPQKLQSGNDTLDLPADTLDNTIVIGRANLGMLKFTQHALTVPASATLNSEQISVNISTKPFSVRSKEKLDHVMDTIVDMQQQNDPSSYYIYDRDGNLPVKR